MILYEFALTRSLQLIQLDWKINWRLWRPSGNQLDAKSREEAIINAGNVGGTRRVGPTVLRNDPPQRCLACTLLHGSRGILHLYMVSKPASSGASEYGTPSPTLLRGYPAPTCAVEADSGLPLSCEYGVTVGAPAGATLTTLPDIWVGDGEEGCLWQLRAQ